MLYRRHRDGDRVRQRLLRQRLHRGFHGFCRPVVLGRKA